jgi:Holliday junction resolvasome RuvABC endonuclease subunit
MDLKDKLKKTTAATALGTMIVGLAPVGYGIVSEVSAEINTLKTRMIKLETQEIERDKVLQRDLREIKEEIKGLRELLIERFK